MKIINYIKLFVADFPETKKCCGYGLPQRIMVAHFTAIGQD